MQNMAKAFKTTPDKVKPFFVGGRKVIKSNVDEPTAEKYRSTLEKIGLVIKLEDTAAAAAASAIEQADTGSISMAEVGADVLENPPVVKPQPIGDISSISMADVGADVVENPPEVVPQQIGDISSITMAEVGSDVLENPPVVEVQPIGDISGITMAEVGADIIENPKPAEKAPNPDTSELSVDDNK